MVQKSKRNRPRACTARQLRKFGVERLAIPGVWLKCLACRDGWAVNIRRGGLLPRGYWKCPQGCNHPPAG